MSNTIHRTRDSNWFCFTKSKLKIGIPLNSEIVKKILWCSLVLNVHQNSKKDIFRTKNRFFSSIYIILWTYKYYNNQSSATINLNDCSEHSKPNLSGFFIFGIIAKQINNSTQCFFHLLTVASIVVNYQFFHNFNLFMSSKISKQKKIHRIWFFKTRL